MTASADLKTPLATAAAAAAAISAAAKPRAPDLEYMIPSRLPDQPLLFKKRKLLPHPKPEGLTRHTRTHSLPVVSPKNGLSVDASDLSSGAALNSQSPRRPRPANSHALKHQPRRIGTGPDLPPTPPAHSRNSSSSHSVIPSSPTFVDTPDTSTDDVQTRPRPKPQRRPSPPRTPKTPPAQRSPPTPDVTPPQIHVEKRPRKVRPPLVSERIPSKTTTESRSASFRTAPENPYSSEEEDGRSTLRAMIPSMRTSSQSTVRQVNGDGAKTKPVGLGLGLESSSPESNPTPKSTSGAKGDLVTLDGEWADENDVEQVWDDNLGRNVVVRKRMSGMAKGAGGASGRRANSPLHREEVVEDAINTVSPTNATEALRAMRLPERALTFPSPSPQGTPAKTVGALPPTSQHHQQQQPQQQSAGVLEPSPHIDVRRFSGMSSKSTVSTVVEAILVETPPRRHKTLRHVRKQTALRDSGSEASPSSSVTASVQLEEQPRGRPRRPQLPPNGSSGSEARHQSYASTRTAGTTGTTNSIASRKARREVWKSGAIPVVIVPDRRSSVKSNSRTPSLRSTSSRRSRRSQSMGSAPLSQMSQVSRTKDLTPFFDKPSRRGRAMSESDGSAPGDQRTIDYPPIVPVRTSSLSAPTSRNGSRTGSRAASLTGSRAGSLTAHSLRELDVLHAQLNAHNLAEGQKGPAQQGPGQQRPDQQDRDHRRKVQAQHDRRQQPSVLKDKTVTRQKALSEPRSPDVRVEAAPSDESIKVARDHPMHKLSVDHHGDPLFGRRLNAQNTPFSMHSVETNATSNAEVSEAMAVNIYPHQNTSVLMVDHSTSTRLSGSSDSSSCNAGHGEDAKPPSKAAEEPCAPTLKRPARKALDAAVDPNVAPVTPPQPFFSMDDVDSPLRNPRAPPAPPPEPPAIQFIPATPSGLTPTHEREKQLGNFYDEVGDHRPGMRRPLALVRRALSGRRRHSEYGPSSSSPRGSGLLTRAFSLSRSSSLRRATADRIRSKGKAPAVMSPDDEPADETRLHPYWRPARLPFRDDEDYDDDYYEDDDYYDEDEHFDGRRRDGRRRGGEDDGSDDDDDWDRERGRDHRTLRYPRIDNRPAPLGLRPGPPRRRLSERIKRTFAILPLDDSDSDVGRRNGDHDDGFPASAPDSPIRRTVRRTPSGNLRVVRHRGSLDSLDALDSARRPYTAPEDGSGGESSAPKSWRRRSASFWRPETHVTEPPAVGGGDGMVVLPPRRRALPRPGSSAGARGGGHHRLSSLLRSLSTGRMAKVDGLGHGRARGYAGRLHGLPRRLNERRREKRSRELRRTISGPREVRDGVGDVIRRSSYRDAYTQAAGPSFTPAPEFVQPQPQPRQQQHTK